MKNLPYQLNLHRVLTVVAVLFFLSACNDTMTTKILKTKLAKQKDFIASVEGIPFYSSYELFDKYSSETSLKKKKDRKAFESEYKFTSLLSEFELLKENKVTLSTTDLIDISNGVPVLNFFNDIRAEYVNRDGLAIIGSALLYFSNKQTKSLLLTSFEHEAVQKAVELLKKAQFSDMTKQLFVSDVKIKILGVLNNRARTAYIPYYQIEIPANGSNGGDGHLYKTRLTIQCATSEFVRYSYDYDNCNGYQYDEYGNLQCIPTTTPDGVYYHSDCYLTATGIKDGGIADNGRSVYMEGYLDLYLNGVRINTYDFNVYQDGTNSFTVGRSWGAYVDQNANLEFAANFDVAIYYRKDSYSNYYDPQSFIF